MADTTANSTEPRGATDVLVVEDDVTLRDTIQWALEDEGLVVETASDGQQALDQLARARPSLVILDMRLPRIGGEGVAAGVRAKYQETIPIIVVTADGRAAEKARRVGAADYLHKPFELAELLAKVRRALGKP